jgi:hypothetical protein
VGEDLGGGYVERVGVVPDGADRGDGGVLEEGAVECTA